MVGAAMAANAALGTRLTPSKTNGLRSLLIWNPSASSSAASCPTSSLRVVRNHDLRSSYWNYDSSLGVPRLPTKGWCRSGKKCRAVVEAVGQKQQQQASRDRVVDFGKFKGAMMGTLSSKHLKWMVKNLRSGPLSDWSECAEEVLADPYYGDRLEWEKVEKLMTAAHDVGRMARNRDAVLAPAKMYGWDLQDDAGWRKVNFSLLGTSNGGRIPRVKAFVTNMVPEKKKPAPRRKESISVRSAFNRSVDDSSSSGSLRDELMRRRTERRERLIGNRGLLSDSDEAAQADQVLRSKFPGREALVRTARSYDISDISE